MSKTPTFVKKLSAIRVHINEYSDSGSAAKATLHSAGRSFLRALAEDLGLGKGDFDMRSNKAGIAVSGEVTLHSDSLYVQLMESCVGSGGVSILYRSCSGRKDCCGHTNNFVSIKSLNDDGYDRFLSHCKKLAGLVTEAA